VACGWFQHSIAMQRDPITLNLATSLDPGQEQLRATAYAASSDPPRFCKRICAES